MPSASVEEMSRKTKVQKGIKIEHTIVQGAGHFFEDKNEELKQIVGDYVDMRMIEIEKAKREAE